METLNGFNGNIQCLKQNIFICKAVEEEWKVVFIFFDVCYIAIVVAITMIDNEVYFVKNIHLCVMLERKGFWMLCCCQNNSL